jgi:hypothetical protein
MFQTAISLSTLPFYVLYVSLPANAQGFAEQAGMCLNSNKKALRENLSEGLCFVCRRIKLLTKKNLPSAFFSCSSTSSYTSFYFYFSFQFL